MDKPSTTTSSTRVLLVEDHDDARECLKRLLCRRGHSVHAAPDARTALAMSMTNEFDLVVTDIGLPDYNGWQLLGMLRARRPRLQAIALSAYDMEQDFANSRAAGFLDHIVKPIRAGILERAMQNAARLRAA